MTIATVKAASPKGYKTMTYINAGLASSLDNYYRCEEGKQVNKIVEELLAATASKNYFEAVIYIYPFVMQSQNREDIKQLILKRYCDAKVKISE